VREATLAAMEMPNIERRKKGWAGRRDTMTYLCTKTSGVMPRYSQVFLRENELERKPVK